MSRRSLTRLAGAVTSGAVACSLHWASKVRAEVRPPTSRMSNLMSSWYPESRVELQGRVRRRTRVRQEGMRRRMFHPPTCAITDICHPPSEFASQHALSLPSAGDSGRRFRQGLRHGGFGTPLPRPGDRCAARHRLLIHPHPQGARCAAEPRPPSALSIARPRARPCYLGASAHTHTAACFQARESNVPIVFTKVLYNPSMMDGGVFVQKAATPSTPIDHKPSIACYHRPCYIP